LYRHGPEEPKAYVSGVKKTPEHNSYSLHATSHGFDQVKLVKLVKLLGVRVNLVVSATS
jgi:hypothetical protein